MKQVRSHFSLIAFALVLVFGLSLSTVARAQTQTSIFINEIHYDNDGTDTGESIEVAGPAGTDLTGWSLVLYNGSGGSTYDTTPLTGTIPNQQGGLGTIVVSYPSNGIQNGSPDGIALVDNSGGVVQFLSYEGSFAAVGGPADGMASVDIGVAEGSSAPVGSSLQLGGSGTVYEDFSWQSSAPNTFGGVNTGQTFGDGSGGVLSDPLINEFVFNHTGTDISEYIEVAGDPNSNYSAFTVLEIEGDGTGSGLVDEVITVGTTNGDGLWTSDFLNNALENGSVTLLLVENFSGNAGDDLDTNNDGTFDVEPWTRVVDDVAVSDGGSGDLLYSAVVLVPEYDGLAFSPGGASRIPDATDSDAITDWVRNDFDGAGVPALGSGTPATGEAFNTPGHPNVAVPSFTPIYDIQFTTSADGASPVVDQSVTTLGVVTAVFDGGSDVFIQDGSGPWQGLFLFSPNQPLAVGDFVLVNGDVSEFHGLTEIANGVVSILSNGNSLPSSSVLATGDVAQEQWESVLVQVADVLVEDADLGFGEWSVNDSSGAVRVDDLGSYSYEPTAGDALAFVRGPLNFSFDDFKIEPRDDNDIALSLVCGAAFTPIFALQGDGAESPRAGDLVTTEGIVVGDFQENDGDQFNTDLDGFYIQDPTGDSNSATSDGIFVFAPGSADVAVGDAVRVRGEVSEFNGLTELGNVSGLEVCGSGTVNATAVSLPATSPDDWEPYEGMLVTFPQALSISEYFNYDRFGEIVLTTERQFQPTAVYEPGSPEAEALATANSLGRITLDDGRSVQNPDPAYHPNGDVFDLDNLFRGGDTVQNLTGVLDYRFNLYRIQPTTGADYAAVNTRPDTHDPVGGSLEVASFNVLNYFTTLTSEGAVCGPDGNMDCRGADTPEELQRQRTKILAALQEINADIVGLIEIQNDAGASVADLVAGLNEAMGADTYAYIDTGFIGTDAIKVALIYKPATVTPVGAYAILDSSENPLFDDTRNRPMLTQTFMENATGEVVTVAVNHLKSKGSDCGGPPDDDPVQGNCNGTRTRAAQAIVEWLATDPTGSGDPDFLIIGDLNAYDKEDPIDVLVNNGYTDLVRKYEGEFAYSYVFDGQLGYLDHALSSSNLTLQVTGATVWNINADEPDIIDYDMTFKQDPQDALYEPNAYRSSDHDPVIVGLDLMNTPPICQAAAPSVDSLWPPNHQFVSIEILNITDPDGDPFTINIDSIFQDEAVDAPDSGNTAPDGQGVGTTTAEVRAERVGTGNGRVYHITFTATDDSGASCTGTVQVAAPVGQNDTAVDDGPLYNSTATP